MCVDFKLTFSASALRRIKFHEKIEKYVSIFYHVQHTVPPSYRRASISH